MKNNLTIQDNYDVTTKLLIEFIETNLDDEMILNSFIRNNNIKIINITNKKIVISCLTKEVKDILKSSYINYLQNAVDNVITKNLKISLVLHGQNLEKLYQEENKNTSENISNKYTFQNYVECEFNKEVIDMGKNLVNNVGKFSPLFITARSGLGKTHLLHAIGNLFINKGLRAVYIDPNDFTRKIIELSKNKDDSISKYIDNFKKFDVLLFDDIQNLGDRSTTLRVLFNIINKAIKDEKQIVIVSDKTPRGLSGFEERFITRFESGLSTNIKDPSINDLIKILKFKLKKESLSPERWEDKALQFIVRNNSSSIRSLEGAVKRVSYLSSKDTASNVKYTYNMISNLFKELSVSKEELTPKRVLTVVSSYYKIKNKDIVGRSRKSEIVIARHIAIYLIRKIINLSYKEIGKFFGNRDHSTIINAVEKIEKQIEINESVKLAIKKLEKNIKTIS